MATSDDFRGHQRLPQMATSEDFLMATDTHGHAGNTNRDRAQTHPPTDRPQLWVDRPRRMRPNLLRSGAAGRRLPGLPRQQFRQRAIVPICNSTGRVAGLIGRTTSAAHGPMYINMSRTHTYDKATALYRPSNPALDHHANVVVCEGTLDALAVAAQAAAFGMSDRYAPVTPSGLAVSDVQLENILAINPLPPVFCGDGDTAGRQATIDWATRAALAGRRTVVTTWPAGDDPASWITEHGEDGLLAVTRRRCLQDEHGRLRPRHAGEIIT